MNSSSRIQVYTDGACSGNPGPGGWGVYIIYPGHNIKELWGKEHATTNNRMELSGAIEALKFLAPTSSVDIYTDSQYVYLGITVWIKNWVRLNWYKKGTNELIKNVDLWQSLYTLTANRDIAWYWVRGHNNNIGNIKADQLATFGAAQAKNNNL